MLSIIAAIGKNNELGKKNDLLWHLPADMKHFRELTTGKTVIMGQKTFESIGRPLPSRRNIILSQDLNFHPVDTETVHSLEELDNLTKNINEEIFIIGGGMIYQLFITTADKLYITHVDAEFPEADTYFPVIDKNIWQETSHETYSKDELNNYNLEFIEYRKRKNPAP